MGYQPYADAVYYTNIFQGTDIPDHLIEKYLLAASRHIDSLTYNRIAAKGFEKLTSFQQEIIREVLCEQAEFEYNNRELLENLLSSYSINGVSLGFGETWNVKIEKGVAIRRADYEMLTQTGLTCRLLR